MQLSSMCLSVGPFLDCFVIDASCARNLCISDSTPLPWGWSTWLSRSHFFSSDFYVAFNAPKAFASFHRLMSGLFDSGTGGGDLHLGAKD